MNTSDGWHFFGDLYTLEDFRAAAMLRVYQSAAIGVILMLSATVQVDTYKLYFFIRLKTFKVACFLHVSENMIHRIRKQFFAAMLRQNIGYYDDHLSGSMAPKLFEYVLMLEIHV